ncbi:MAG: class I SAM-dependent methyltransferase [bacterium]|jgi:ubiquinone/menaquinone biosynthesis C-methylase UbiE
MDFENPDRMYLIFDNILNTRLGSMILPIYRNYIKSLPLSGDETVLELGSGSGIATRHIAGILRRGGGRVLCVDPSKKMTEIARKRLRKHSNVEIRTGDIRSLDIEDSSCDAAFVHFTLHDIDQAIRLDTIKALCRKLKPGARLFLREPTVKFGAVPVEAMRDVLTGGGFTEQSHRLTSAPLFGPMYEAVFIRPAA